MPNTANSSRSPSDYHVLLQRIAAAPDTKAYAKHLDFTDADDLIQQVIVNFLQKETEYAANSETELRKMFFTSLNHASISRRRKEGRVQVGDEYLPDMDTRHQPANRDTPSRQSRLGEETQYLLQAISTLDDELRQVLLWFHVHGLNGNAVAVKMNYFRDDGSPDRQRAFNAKAKAERQLDRLLAGRSWSVLMSSTPKYILLELPMDSTRWT